VQEAAHRKLGNLIRDQGSLAQPLLDLVVKRIAVHAVELRGSRSVHYGLSSKLRFDVLFH
jgi:hypothetical protein